MGRAREMMGWLIGQWLMIAATASVPVCVHLIGARWWWSPVGILVWATIWAICGGIADWLVERRDRREAEKHIRRGEASMIIAVIVIGAIAVVAAELWLHSVAWWTCYFSIGVDWSVCMALWWSRERAEERLCREWVEMAARQEGRRL